MGEQSKKKFWCVLALTATVMGYFVLAYLEEKVYDEYFFFGALPFVTVIVLSYIAKKAKFCFYNGDLGHEYEETANHVQKDKYESSMQGILVEKKGRKSGKNVFRVVALIVGWIFVALIIKEFPSSIAVLLIMVFITVCNAYVMIPRGKYNKETTEYYCKFVMVFIMCVTIFYTGYLLAMNPISVKQAEQLLVEKEYEEIAFRPYSSYRKLDVVRDFSEDGKDKKLNGRQYLFEASNKGIRSYVYVNPITKETEETERMK